MQCHTEEPPLTKASELGSEEVEQDETVTITGEIHPNIPWPEISVAEFSVYVGNETEPAIGPENITVYEYGVRLEEGWNLISTPRILEEKSWDKLTEHLKQKYGDQFKAYSYDGFSGKWYSMDGKNLEPLYAVFVYVPESDIIGFTWTESAYVTPPSRELAEGWNLISLNDINPVPVDQALVSIQYTPDGYVGYTTVFSPSLNDETWVYTVNSDQVPVMRPYEGYWVYMENGDTLAGRMT